MKLFLLTVIFTFLCYCIIIQADFSDHYMDQGGVGWVGKKLGHLDAFQVRRYNLSKAKKEDED